MSFQHLKFRQSGGFAGLVRGCDLRAEALPAIVQSSIRGFISRQRSHIQTLDRMIAER